MSSHEFERVDSCTIGFCWFLTGKCSFMQTFRMNKMFHETSFACICFNDGIFLCAARKIVFSMQNFLIKNYGHLWLDNLITFCFSFIFHSFSTLCVAFYIVLAVYPDEYFKFYSISLQCFHV